jgi:hypothetical protein
MAIGDINAGDSDCTTGLSKRIYDNWKADSRAGFSPDFDTNVPAQGSVKSICWAIAKGVVDEIKAHV